MATNSLQLSRDEVESLYSPLTWVGFVTCFEQRNDRNDTQETLPPPLPRNTVLRPPYKEVNLSS